MSGFDDAPDPRAERETKEAKGIMVLVILATMLFAITQAFDWYTPTVREGFFSEMAQAMFSTFIVPFEVLGFLLLAALVGALYIAHKEVARRG